MTKTFSKVLAVILSLAVLFAVPVMTSAEETATFAVNGKLYGVEGDWHDDYVTDIAIELNGGIASFGADAAVSVGFGGKLDNYKTIPQAELGYSLGTDGKIVIIVAFNNNINHAETYNFHFAEGTFVNEDGALSEEYTFSISGNEIVEALDVEHVSTKPIEKLIDWMYTWGAEGFWLDVIDFIVSILEWFLYI